MVSPPAVFKEEYTCFKSEQSTCFRFSKRLLKCVCVCVFSDGGLHLWMTLILFCKGLHAVAETCGTFISLSRTAPIKGRRLK